METELSEIRLFGICTKSVTDFSAIFPWAAIRMINQVSMSFQSNMRSDQRSSQCLNVCLRGYYLLLLGCQWCRKWLSLSLIFTPRVKQWALLLKTVPSSLYLNNILSFSIASPSRLSMTSILSSAINSSCISKSTYPEMKYFRKLLNPTKLMFGSRERYFNESSKAINQARNRMGWINRSRG